MKNLFRKRQLDAEMDEEMRFHLELRTQQHLEAGMSPAEARRAALRQFGAMESIKETCREGRGLLRLVHIAQDLRFAARILRKNPGFTAVAVLTLAAGIGANTAIFTVVHGVLLRPLPYREPEQLVQIMNGQSRADSRWISVPDLQELRERKDVFEQVAVYGFRSLIDLNGAEPAAVFGAAILPEAFETLGVRPLFGRNFLPHETTGGHDQVILLSHDYWRERFRSDPGIIGRVLQFKDKSYEVVGVMPAGLSFPDPSLVNNESRFWVPLSFSDQALRTRTSFSHQAVGRLKAGVTIQQAQAMMEVLGARLAKAYPESNKDRVFRLVPLREHLVGSVRPMLWMIFGSVAVVLLIACANVANLLLSRGFARQQEVAIRSSLGAGRFRLLRQFLIESFLLSALGCLLGLLLAHYGLQGLRLIIPRNVPRIAEIGLAPAVLGFSLALSFLTTLLAGLAPALKLSNLSLVERLSHANRSATPAGLSIPACLTGFEIALALVLLVAAGLLARSFWVLQTIELGFDPRQVLTVAVTPPPDRSTPETVAGFYAQLAAQIRTLPGAGNVGFVDALPLSGMNTWFTFQIEGRAQSREQGADRRVVSGDYFRAMGIRLLAGRLFSENDPAGAAQGAIINQTMARKYWPDENPLGQRIRVENPAPIEIIGVVDDVRHSGPEIGARPEIYEPLSRHPGNSYLQLVVRTSGEPMQLGPPVRRAILSMNPLWPVDKITSLERMFRGLTATRRFNMNLVGMFGILALVLSVIGIYGVTSYAVVQRTREIGIRMALGAVRREVLAMVLGRGMKLTALGIVIGILAALGLTRVMRGLLFQISPTDPLTFAAVSLLLGGVALLACLIPARRASRVDPMVALRHE